MINSADLRISNLTCFKVTPLNHRISGIVYCFGFGVLETFNCGLSDDENELLKV